MQGFIQKFDRVGLKKLSFFFEKIYQNIILRLVAFKLRQVVFKLRQAGLFEKNPAKKADQKKPKKSTQNLTYPAGFFWLLLKNVSFINILVLFSLFNIIEPKILM